MRNYYLITFAAVCFCISIVAQNNPAFSQNTTSTSPIACYDLANGLGTDAINSLNGTVSNVSAANGFDNGINMAAQFAGNANSKITLPVSAVLRPQQLSVSMWIKATAINDQYILFHKNALSSNFEAAVIAITGGKIKAIKNKNNSATFTVSDLNTITTNTWVHVAADFGDNLRLWINGTLVGSQAGTGGIDFLSTKSFVLGGSGESFNIPFSGAIDNLAFYDTDISADIATIYANATPCTYAGPAQTVACYDLSNGTALDAINNFNGNVANGTAVNGYNGTTNSAIQLAGTGVSKIILPIAASLRPQALGISMWIKVSSTANQYVLFHKNALSTNFEGAVVGIINGKITAIKNKNAG
ncbi:MAG TPA: LamG domain-containing protein, partial [Bacteroidia bacterium]